MAWGRIIALSVGVEGTGTLISGLDIEFRIEKSRTTASNFIDLTIYNATVNTRNNILVRGANLIFTLGYEDEARAVVFVGNIADAESVKDGTDWVTTIKGFTIKAKNQPLSVIPITLSFAAGTPLTNPIQILATASGLVLTGLENIQGVLLPNGWVYAGTFLGALRYIQKIVETLGLGIYIDNNEIVLFRKGIASSFRVVILSRTGGLLTLKNITKAEEERKRIAFTSLIIPQIKINGLVTVKGTLDDGSYIVDKLTMQGDNFGGDFAMTGEATL